jgi:predicted dehydrogenase
MTFFTYRWMPWYRHVRRLIEQGFLGTCHQCSIRYLAAYGLSRKYAWRFDRARSNGVLGDLGSHMIDLARWLVGDVSGVCGRLATFVARDAPDRNALDPANDAAILALQFANGALGTIQVSAVAETAERGQEQHVVLHGEKGTIEVDVHTASGVEIRTVRSGGKLSLEPIPDELMGNADRTKPVLNRAMEMFMTESIGDRLFIDAILEGKPVEPSLFDGYKAQLVIDAAIESHAKGRWISPE